MTVGDVEARRGSREEVRDHRPLGWPGATWACSARRGQARVQGNDLEGLQGQRSQRQKTEQHQQAVELEGGLGCNPISACPVTSDKSLTSLSLSFLFSEMGRSRGQEAPGGPVTCLGWLRELVLNLRL